MNLDTDEEQQALGFLDSGVKYELDGLQEMIMSVLLIAIIVAVLVSVASMGLAILLLLDMNKELLNSIKEEVFKK